MERDLEVKSAFDCIEAILYKLSPGALQASEASAIMGTIRAIDDVFWILC
jgi:hypothetical protein